MTAHGIKWLLSTLSTLTLVGAARLGGIKWTPCKHPGILSLECATLAVPLNYTAGASTETIDLEMTKVNALKQPSKGSILFNPGGPGATGRNFIRAHHFGQAALYMTGGEYDLISFNPRGTGSTIPFSCRPKLDRRNPDNDSKKTHHWNLTASNGLHTLWAEAQSTARQCSEAMGKYGRLIGTTFVARDMMQIVDALNEDGLLRFWGFSYGTVLGATVAAMYPERMDKIVLDGVVNPTQWWSGRMVDSTLDTEAAIDGFFSSCVENVEYCRLARDGSSAIDLREKFHIVAQQMKLESNGSWFEDRIMYGLMSTAQWPDLADDLYDLFTQNPSSKNGSSLPESFKSTQDARSGIRCGVSGLRATDPTEVLPMMREIYSTAPTLGRGDAEGMLGCSAWKMSAEERYTKPFNNIKTRNPILFIGNRNDPRTPLASARNASAAFPGSVLLTSNGYGHCSNSQPSLCIGKAVKEYFANGTLPAEGTVCEPSVPAFRNSSRWDVVAVDRLLWGA